MTTATNEPRPPATLDADAERIFEASYDRICRRTDRMFAYLLVAEWLAGIAIALWLSPQTWSGARANPHIHLYAALFLGAAITALPVVLAIRFPGQATTRYVVAIAQLSWSGLFIHLTGGRIETHFHIFGSLACLAFYRDFRVIVPATLVVAADHFARGVVWPESIYGVLNPEWWRFLEHAGWVLFIDAFLVLNCVQARRDLRELSRREAAITNTHAELRRAAATLEDAVTARTGALADRNHELSRAMAKLATSEALSRAVLDTADEAIVSFSESGEILASNPATRKVFSLDTAPSRIDELRFVVDGEPAALMGSALWGNDSTHEQRRELAAVDAQGATLCLSACLRAIDVEGERRYVAFMRDLTEVKAAAANVAELNTQLMRQSRIAGMAEVATGVLHNVGNVLNSVNVAMTTAAEAVQHIDGSRLGRLIEVGEQRHGSVAAMLEQDPERVAAFLDKVTQQLDSRQQCALEQLSELARHIDHMKSVIAKQQSYAKQGGVHEDVTARALVDDAISLLDASLERHDITLHVSHAAPEQLHALDRHRVLQILVNLVGNARDALKESDDRRMTVETSLSDGHVVFAVTDSGVGISEEARERLFTHGFTTKAEGHGFGLHNSALAATDMGGTLTASSRGLGHGATFTLSIPTHEMAAAAA